MDGAMKFVNKDFRSDPQLTSGSMINLDTDEFAFGLVLGRLEADVGGILDAVLNGRVLSGESAHAPFWAVARMMFPVAESIADLIYRLPQTSEQLVKVFQNEFDVVRPRYAAVAGTLTQMYRHSLTHQDELRLVRSAGRTVFWEIGFRGDHLALRKDRGPNDYTLSFNLVSFYEDLRAVLKLEQAKEHRGEAIERYKKWGLLDLGPNPTGVRLIAADEIARLPA